MAGHGTVRAWRPAVPGVTEVYHAHITDHVYPMHTHDAWTLLIVDDGAIRYDLHRTEHGAVSQLVTLLPPHVPHNGRPTGTGGFRKRVIYLESPYLPDGLIGSAVSTPALRDAILRCRIHQLHQVLERPGEELAAESRFVLVAERLGSHLRGHDGGSPPVRQRSIARQLRDMLDARFREKFTLAEISEELHVSAAHLVRAFSREFEISPHQYQIGRRVDLARKLLLQGMPPCAAATAAGFHDQAHLNRHFKHTLGTTPGRFARSGRAAGRTRACAGPAGTPG